MRTSIRQFCIALCCLAAAVAMILPASDGLFYCFPMQRIMIEDCCGEDEEKHETPILTHAQCCEKMDALDVDTPISSAVPALIDGVFHPIAMSAPRPYLLDKYTGAVLGHPRVRGPPERGPPRFKRSLFIRHQALLI